MTKMILTQALLKEYLHYNPNTGEFTWIKKVASRANRIKVGEVAGTLSDTGYIIISLLCRRYRAHHLAWLYSYGVNAKNQIDHINGIPTDNRMVNLRLATNSENQQNRLKSLKTKSPYIGVDYYKSRSVWRSRIKLNGKTTFLGYYDSPALAHQAYVEAKRQIHTFNPVLRES